MHELIDQITGCPEESMTTELIQEAIEELACALSNAYAIREKLKVKSYEKSITINEEA